MVEFIEFVEFVGLDMCAVFGYPLSRGAIFMKLGLAPQTRIAFMSDRIIPVIGVRVSGVRQVRRVHRVPGVHRVCRVCTAGHPNRHDNQAEKRAKSEVRQVSQTPSL